MIYQGFIIKCDECGTIADDYHGSKDEVIYYQQSKGWFFYEDDFFELQALCPQCNKEGV